MRMSVTEVMDAIRETEGPWFIAPNGGIRHLTRSYHNGTCPTCPAARSRRQGWQTRTARR